MQRALRQGLITCALAVSAASAFAQQDYPTKPIRLIVPYAPGGATTILARLAGEKLTERWGQQILVDNRPGGNAIIGSEAMVRSAPDGYTVLMMTSAHVIRPLLTPNLPFDTIRDFAPVATLASSELIMALHPSVPAANLLEFISLAKSRPGQLNYATVGSGGSTHLASEYLNILAGLKTESVPYKGTAPALTDLIGGQVHFFLSPPTDSLVPFIKAGKLRAIAVGGSNRKPALPNVPTFAEAGMPNYQMSLWYGIQAPAATPRRIIDKLSGEFGKVMATAEMKDRLLIAELDPMISTPEQFAAMIQAETEKYARIIRTANIKLEN
jgi:tripartite-type tricarboxylate transporter receptor subunit TctC